MKLTREEALRGMTIDGKSSICRVERADEKLHMLGIRIRLDHSYLGKDSTRSSGMMIS